MLCDKQWLDGLSEEKSADPKRLPFSAYVNPEIVTLVPLTEKHVAAKEYLRKNLQAHVSETGSARAQRVLNSWHRLFDDEDLTSPKFTMVVPASEKMNPLTQTDVGVEQEAWNNAQV